MFVFEEFYITPAIPSAFLFIFTSLSRSLPSFLLSNIISLFAPSVSSSRLTCREAIVDKTETAQEIVRETKKIRKSRNTHAEGEGERERERERDQVKDKEQREVKHFKSGTGQIVAR